MIRIKRVYEEPAKEDGYRILVDRLWPRGLTKQRAKVDLWMKEIAPSDALRVKRLEREHGTVTLLYGRKVEKQNQAVLIAAALKGKK
jgi:uncharacterized protein YeaO (DUF488 family)